MRKLLLFPFFGCFLLHAEAPESLFIGTPDISSKNISAFQQGVDQIPGVLYLGYCTDLQVVHFKINRSEQPTDSAIVSYFKSFGINNFSIKESVTDRQFMNNCKQFEPRQ